MGVVGSGITLTARRDRGRITRKGLPLVVMVLVQAGTVELEGLTEDRTGVRTEPDRKVPINKVVISPGQEAGLRGIKAGRRTAAEVLLMAVAAMAQEEGTVDVEWTTLRKETKLCYLAWLWKNLHACGN